MAWTERRDEAKANAPEAPRYRSRKDTKTWCRGKRGVPHQRELRISRWAVAMRGDRGSACYPPPWDPSRWLCYHEIWCPVCGKTLKILISTECPDHNQRG